MLDEKDRNRAAGTLTYNSEWNRFELDGYELQSADRVDISVFGYWIPGQIALDTAGWYLLTLDQVGIRLHAGLTARFSEPGSSRTPLLYPSQIGTSRILIVDDDPALLQALPQTVALRLPEAKVDVSDSTQGALEQILAHEYDTIVSDIKMPGMDGLELLAKIHELRPETPALLITGHGDHDLAVQALRGGAYDYILKPIDRDYFVAVLDRAIQTRQLRRQVVEQQLALELHTKSLERLVEQRTRELVEANATKDRVIGVVSHELEIALTPLKEITWLLHQKLEGADIAEIVSQGFVEIEHSISRTEILVQELLNTSRIETTTFILHRQRCDLFELCRNVLEEYARRTGSMISCECFDAPMEVEADVDRVTQLLTDLLSNAHRYSKGDSLFTVTLQRVGHEAIIAVSDLDARSASEPGFYVSRKIMEGHGGRLEVQSFPDNRSTFFIILPRRIDPTIENVEDAALTRPTQAVWKITGGLRA